MVKPGEKVYIVPEAPKEQLSLKSRG
jgi:hypothetical protein